MSSGGRMFNDDEEESNQEEEDEKTTEIRGLRAYYDRRLSQGAQEYKLSSQRYHRRNKYMRELNPDIEPEVNLKDYDYQEGSDDQATSRESVISEQIGEAKSFVKHKLHQVTEKGNDIHCLVCHGDEGDKGEDGKDLGDIMVCENALCYNGGHVLCLKRVDPSCNFTEVPKEQWLCNVCARNLKCSSCGWSCLDKPEKGPLVLCEYCERAFHVTCVETKQDLTSDWRCEDCSCQICGLITPMLLSCSGCGLFIHCECDDAGVNTELMLFNCPHCRANPIDRFSAKDSEEDSMSNENEARVEDAKREMVREEIVDPCGALDREHENVYLSTISKLRMVKYDKQKGLGYVYLYRYLIQGVPFSQADYDNWIFISRLSSGGSKGSLSDLKPPPQNLGRLLDQVTPFHLKYVELKVERDGITFKADFMYRDLTQAVLQLLQSTINLMAGPLHQVDSDCPAQSRWGSRLPSLHEQFVKDKHPDPNSKIVALQFYSDGTNSNFLSLHPIIISIPEFDRNARALNMATAQVTIAMAPVAGNIRCFKGQKQITMGSAMFVAKNNLTAKSILRIMLRDCVEILMKELKALENGVWVNLHNQFTKLYCFLYSWICDMEERRDILNLSMAMHWVCTHCFARPLPNSACCGMEQLDELVDFGELRTDANIQLIETVLRKAEQEYTVVDSKFNFEHRFGFKQSSKCPISSQTNFIVDGAGAYFAFDCLHLLDGIVVRLWKMLEVVYGGSLKAVTMDLGNCALGVASDMKFHKMEEALHDFQFVALAFVIGDGLQPNKSWLKGLMCSHRNNHPLLMESFLDIIYILKDEAPGLLIDRLENAIAEAQSYLAELEADLKCLGHKFEETSKIHELFAHVVRQLELFGSAGGISSNIGEFSHPEHKALVKLGSKQTDYQADTVLQGAFYKACFTEISHVFELDETVPASRPFNPVATFRLCQMQMQFRKLGAIGMLKRNLAQVIQLADLNIDGSDPRVQISGTNEFLDLAQITQFSISIKCYLRCSFRKQDIKRDMTARVFGPVGVKFEQNHRVLAFGPINPVISAQCRFENCRFHGRDLQLHSSYAKMISPETEFGIPLLFVSYQDELWAIVLPLVRDVKTPRARIIVCARPSDGTNYRLVNLARLRSTCLAVVREHTFFVFPVGERTFGHL